ncbi:MAG: hypothetical protein FJ009_16930 [Chloroflexi bacterium]|nr:hypothetical protein [Chloroflexota bacterium]
MIDTPYRGARDDWAKAWKFFQRLPYLDRESSRAHVRLFVVQLVFVLSLVFCMQLDSRPGEIWVKLLGVWDGRGYLIVAALSLFAALMTGTEFFRSLYGIKDFRAARDHYLVSLFGVGFIKGLKGLVRALFSFTWFWHLNALLFGIWGYDYFVVENGEIKKKDLDGPIIRAGGPCFLVIIKDTALVLEQDGCFTRVVKPGFGFLEPFETIREAVDLRPQVRAQPVKALTKDGIPIQVKLEIEFMIQPHPRRQIRQPAEDPYLFREDAARRAAYNRTVFHRDTGEETMVWKDLVMARAEFEMQCILNTFVLDRLIEPEDANPRAPLDLQETPRREIQDKLRRNLYASGELRQLDAIDLGVLVTRVTLEDFQIPEKFADAVKENRIKSWQAEWIRRVKISQAEGDAAGTRWREAARAQAQAEMLRAIARGLEGLDDANRANLSHLFALRMIESLEQMTLDPWAQTFVPEQTLAMLRRLRDLYV